LQHKSKYIICTQTKHCIKYPKQNIQRPWTNDTNMNIQIRTQTKS